MNSIETLGPPWFQLLPPRYSNSSDVTGDEETVQATTLYMFQSG